MLNIQKKPGLMLACGPCRAPDLPGSLRRWLPASARCGAANTRFANNPWELAQPPERLQWESSQQRACEPAALFHKKPRLPGIPAGRGKKQKKTADSGRTELIFAHAAHRADPVVRQLIKRHIVMFGRIIFITTDIADILFHGHSPWVMTRNAAPICLMRDAKPQAHGIRQGPARRRS